MDHEPLTTSAERAELLSALSGLSEHHHLLRRVLVDLDTAEAECSRLSKRLAQADAAVKALPEQRRRVAELRAMLRTGLDLSNPLEPDHRAFLRWRIRASEDIGRL